jgi:2-methylisocitrate lyase-like PEP mutase family enzyme
MEFKNLHQQNQPLLIANVWDVPSVKIAEQLHFQALGTSSAAIASLLGYKDGEEMKFSELAYFVERIAANSNLPLSVDLESGYSRNPVEICDHIKQLVDLGVVGINIEDSIIIDGKRVLLNADDFAEALSEIKQSLKRDHIEIFINVRTDTFIVLKENHVEETKRRIKLYEEAGADGIFTPAIVKAADIKEIVNSTNLPVNVMCMPNLPDFNTLTELGVKRISMGNFLLDKMYQELENIAETVLQQQSFQSIF